jgi:hypothetical protein
MHLLDFMKLYTKMLGPATKILCRVYNVTVFVYNRHGPISWPSWRWRMSFCGWKENQ